MAKEQRDVKSLWIEGKKTWNDLYGGALAMATFWKNLSFILAIVCVILAGGVIWSTRQTHVIPYVVFANDQGKTLLVHKAIQISAIPKKILTHTIGRFVQHTREVIDDPLAEKNVIRQIYGHLDSSDPAYTAVTNFLRLRTQETVKKHISVTVKITTILWQSQSTALVQWNETAWLPSGESISNGSYEGYVSVKILPPMETTDPTFQTNPLGIYVNKFSWAKVS